MAEAPAAQKDGKTGAEYLVLARKYRPQSFAELKGQDALVRTLTNAIETGRIAHAFMLTGVRGVGKTTTARIIARALNCAEGPTPNPCGQCEQCVSISQDRNIDVLEIDAASHTGVDNIRDLIDTVQYAPLAARYKIFIVDEVHMLSKQAFAALLKTLEEPPPHVKFIFATTDIQMVPVTILSRCQRFDLRRIPAEVLAEYYATLAGRENVKAEAEGISLIARAADGSARDGLSLLDQAIARSGGNVTADTVRDMLGLADRNRTIDLFDAIMRGDTGGSLAALEALYSVGANPLMVLQDLLELTHFVTKLKAAPDLARDGGVPESERTRGLALSKALSMPVLARAWQMLLKGAGELRQAPQPQLALEMIILRLLYVSDQPTPGDLMKQLKDGTLVPAGNGAPVPAGGGNGHGARAQLRTVASAAVAAQSRPQPVADSGAAVAAVAPMPQSFEDMVALVGEKREALLQSSLIHDAHLVDYAAGQIVLRLRDGAPQALIGQLQEKLIRWTGQPWSVDMTSRKEGRPTLGQQRKAAADVVRDEVLAHPVVAETLRVFPEAVVHIRDGNDE